MIDEKDTDTKHVILETREYTIPKDDDPTWFTRFYDSAGGAPLIAEVRTEERADVALTTFEWESNLTGGANFSLIMRDDRSLLLADAMIAKTPDGQIIKLPALTVLVPEDPRP